MAMTKAVLGALITALVLKIFLFDFMIAEGNSMEPAIHPGKILVINRLRYGLRPPLSRSYLLRWKNPDPGEVVVFYTPMGDLAVKRCAALPDKEHFIALGDNSLQSYVARAYGPVPVGNIIGKALGVQ